VRQAPVNEHEFAREKQPRDSRLREEQLLAMIEQQRRLHHEGNSITPMAMPSTGLRS
jgi:hypothetical protein